MAQTQQNDRLKDYVTVAERVAQFYAQWPVGRILTAVVEHDQEKGFVLMRAEVYRELAEETPSATGHAFEVRGDSYVNKTSYIENAETSAVGRALALLGYQIKGGIASREEMQKGERQAGPRPVESPAPARPMRHIADGVDSVPGVPAPDAEHGRLDTLIAEALSILDKPAQDLSAWCRKKFGTNKPWYDHDAEQKETMLLMLNTAVNKMNEDAK